MRKELCELSRALGRGVPQETPEPPASSWVRLRRKPFPSIVTQGFLTDASCEIADAGQTHHFHAKGIAKHRFGHRGHANGIRTQFGEGGNFVGRFKSGSGQSEVGPLVNPNPVLFAHLAKKFSAPGHRLRLVGEPGRIGMKRSDKGIRA